MLNYILRRTFYSVWVILGVLLLTFLLFNMAAGDPAAAILGDNAFPEEVESFRDQLGSNLPLFYGRLCPTLAYPEYSGSGAEQLKFQKAFSIPQQITAQIMYDNGEKTLFSVTDDKVVFTAPAGKKICSVKFFKEQSSPWNSQFFRSLSELISFKKTFPYVTFFNFGTTLLTREQVSDVLKQGMLPSLSLMLPIFAGEIFFGVMLALFAAAFPGQWQDRVLLIFSVISMSVSYLVAIIFGQWFFGYCFEWFPVWGFGEGINYALPVLIGILCGTGTNIRFFRTVFADELRKEYLRTAAAKGIHPVKIYSVHLLRNSLIQIITRISAGLPFLFTGSLLLESFFGIPGLGFAGIEALRNSDIQLLKALVVLSALLFVVMNLLADLTYAWADPRIKLE